MRCGFWELPRLTPFVCPTQKSNANNDADSPRSSTLARVQARTSAKQQVDDSLFLAYLYQTGRIRYEQQRLWAAGLLDSLDRQRQRILESFLREQGGHMTIAPDDIDAEMQLALRGIASGEFTRQLKSQRMEAQQ